MSLFNNSTGGLLSRKKSRRYSARTQNERIQSKLSHMELHDELRRGNKIILQDAQQQ